MDWSLLSTRIVSWLKDYALSHKMKVLVVGVSGGIDSAVVSTLAAQTSLPTYVMGLPIRQDSKQESLSDSHMSWLGKYPNVHPIKVDLTDTFEEILRAWNNAGHGHIADDLHAQANTRSRIRMVALYHIAASVKGLVIGTGNKIEDYGIGFFTKYGDGGVDIAPIADLYKSEVYGLADYLGVEPAIRKAAPTDGLWDDSRNDETQIGCSYEELEKVMREEAGENIICSQNAKDVYDRFHQANQHKMLPIPTFKLAEHGFSRTISKTPMK